MVQQGSLLCLIGAAVCAELALGAAERVQPNLWRSAAEDASRSETDQFVERLLRQLSLEEKIGQMIQADIASISPADLRHYKLGSILAGGNAAPGNNLRTTPQAGSTSRTRLRGFAHPRGQFASADSYPVRHRRRSRPRKLSAPRFFRTTWDWAPLMSPNLLLLIGQATAAEVADGH